MRDFRSRWPTIMKGLGCWMIACGLCHGILLILGLNLPRPQRGYATVAPCTPANPTHPASPARCGRIAEIYPYVEENLAVSRDLFHQTVMFHDPRSSAPRAAACPRSALPDHAPGQAVG